jgi:putative phosphoribosyl transferase
MRLPFHDRFEAGRLLAARLCAYRNLPDVVVLGLPRGGLPVAWEVARALAAPLDVLIVRKLGFPGFEELALGAIASGGVRVVDEFLIRAENLSPAIINAIAEREQRELERRENLYRKGRPARDVAGKTVILVDDGIATGSTMLAASQSLRLRQPRRIVVAVPVAPVSARDDLKGVPDEFICLASPQPFEAVGLWYCEFPQVSDREVQELLGSAAESQPAATLAAAGPD